VRGPENVRRVVRKKCFCELRKAFFRPEPPLERFECALRFATKAVVNRPLSSSAERFAIFRVFFCEVGMEVRFFLIGQRAIFFWSQAFFSGIEFSESDRDLSRWKAFLPVEVALR